MYLQQIVILNYKSCKKVTLTFNSKSPITLIGQTDAGKSTSLKAIGILLDDKVTPLLPKEGQSCSDISTTPLVQSEYENTFHELNLPIPEATAEPSITIIGIFNKQDGDFTDEFFANTSPNLQWALESYSDKQIAILRQFSNSYPNGHYMICTTDCKDDMTELWKQKDTLLTEIVKKLGIAEDEIRNENKSGRFKNIEKFRAIYKKATTYPQWKDYEEFTKKDRKYFPLYRYVDWKEISLKNVEEMAKDTMGTTIDEYADNLNKDASRASREATDKVNSELSLKTQAILKDIPNIISIHATVQFQIDSTVSEISVEKNTADGNIKLESQGDGVKKQIGFAFMRLAALQGNTEDTELKKFFWAFDEPEVHLYPAEKRGFYETIKKLSEGIFQTIISTHSTVFVDKSKLDTIRKVHLVDKYTNIDSCTTTTDIYETLGIKNSDFLFYDLFIAVEGDTEDILFKHFYFLYFNRTLLEDSIQLVNLDGETNWKDNLDKFTKIIKDFSDPQDTLITVLDRDTNVNKENVFLVGKYDIEDSIANEYWIKLVKDVCGVDITDNDLENLRSNLSSSQENKFYKLLKAQVEENPGKIAHLPSKKECAKLMKNYINSKDGIPLDIQKILEKIKNILNI